MTIARNEIGLPVSWVASAASITLYECLICGVVTTEIGGSLWCRTHHKNRSFPIKEHRVRRIRDDEHPADLSLWECPECGYTGISGVSGGVGPWPGDGKVRCPSRTCEYATVMEHHGALYLEGHRP